MLIAQGNVGRCYAYDVNNLKNKLGLGVTICL